MPKNTYWIIVGHWQHCTASTTQTICCVVIGWFKLICRYTNTMMTSSNGNIFRVTGPLCGEFTGPGEFPTQRPVTRSFDVCFDLRLNKRLSKQPRGWWLETQSWSLWCHCNAWEINDWHMSRPDVPCCTRVPHNDEISYHQTIQLKCTEQLTRHGLKENSNFGHKISESSQRRFFSVAHNIVRLQAACN